MILEKIIAIIDLILAVAFFGIAFKYFPPQKKNDIFFFLSFILITIALVVTSFDEIKAAWQWFLNEVM